MHSLEAAGRLPAWDPEQVAAALIGAVFGATGYLIVGISIQRLQIARQARNAGRAVNFELAVNAINCQVALDHAAFETLSRATYEAPEWRAAWVEPLSDDAHPAG